MRTCHRSPAAARSASETACRRVHRVLFVLLSPSLAIGGGALVERCGVRWAASWRSALRAAVPHRRSFGGTGPLCFPAGCSARLGRLVLVLPAGGGGGGGQFDAALLAVALPGSTRLLGVGALVEDRHAVPDLARLPLVADHFTVLEGEGEHSGLGGGAAEVVEGEVAQAVVDVGVAEVAARREHVGVAADDGVGAGVDEGLGEAGGVRNGAVLPLQAPMQVCDDGVGLLGGLGDRFDEPGSHLDRKSTRLNSSHV